MTMIRRGSGKISSYTTTAGEEVDMVRTGQTITTEEELLLEESKAEAEEASKEANKQA